MNTLFRTFCASLLSACLLSLSAAGCRPLPARAADTDCFRYSLRSDGSVELLCQDKTITQVDIPSEIDGHTVTALAENCFAACADLTEVTIPDTITTLGAYAFCGCSSLTELYLPASVTTIGNYAFDTTENMTAFLVDAENPCYQSPDGVLYDKAGSTLLKYPESRPDTSYTVLASCRTIAPWAFIGTVYLEQLALGQVSTIGEDAFYYCISLKEIDIPEGVTALPGATFGCCANLERVTLPPGMLALGDNCFYSCVSLESINLPDGLQKLGTCTFCHCTALQSLTVPESLTTVNAYCMGYLYQQDTEDYALQEPFTLYVRKNSAAWKYAATNHIDYEIVRDNTGFYLGMIGLFVVLILILSVQIVRLLHSRKGNGVHENDA